MCCPNPRFHRVAQMLRQLEHRFGLLIRNRAGAFVVSKVPFFPKSLELIEQRLIGSDGVFQCLDDSKVMRFTRGPITGRGQGCRRQLQSGVVGNIEPPIRA